MSGDFTDRVGFVPLDRLSGVEWTPLTHYLPLMPITALPVADSEILHLAHYLPLGIHLGGDSAARPMVSALLHPEFGKSLPLGLDGRWQAPYAPIALRTLPFRLDSKEKCLFSPMLAALCGDATLHAESSPGTPSPAFRQIMDLLKRLEYGVRRLSDAASLLMAADLLVPLEELPHKSGERFLVVSADRLARLDNTRVAGLTAMGMLPMELAAACLFSLRHLSRRVVDEDGRYRSAGRTAFRPEPAPAHDGFSILGQNFGLDESPLFSLDDLLRNAEPRR
ncbi:MAG: SapC family protein [Proteobacteria bacterium]|nr:SapC family protein [Pseudomonadota bacterium]